LDVKLLYTNPPKVEVKDLTELDVGKHEVIIASYSNLQEYYDMLGISKNAVGNIIDRKLEGFIPTSKGLIYVIEDLKAPMKNLEARYTFAKGVKSLRDRIRDLAVISPNKELLYDTILGSLLASYKFELFKKDKQRVLDKITFYVEGGVYEENIKKAESIASGVYVARDIGNLPANHADPSKLEKIITELFKSYSDVRVEVLDSKDLKEKGLNGILAVGSGSKVEPRMIIIEYKGAGWGEEDNKVAIIGKTVTFDSGGLDLKPHEGMDEMKYDKCGGGVAAGIIVSMHMLKSINKIISILPAVENLPSNNPYKPRDVIRMYNGVTVEVTNTDAEGRLTIADAMSYAELELKARRIIDIATLTGAVVVALGSEAAGVAGTDIDFINKLLEINKLTGERFWEYPLYDEYKDYLESKVADIANSGGREASLCTSGAFLKEFVEKALWTHIDVAGVAWVKKKGPKTPVYEEGATGWGLESIVRVIEQF